MPKRDEIPTAKVFVWKDEEAGEPGLPWKVGLLGWGDVLVIVQDCLTYEDAWAFLYKNYKRKK